MKRIPVLFVVFCFYLNATAMIPDGFTYPEAIKYESVNNPQQTTNIIIGLNTSLGGYVFYITPDGKHGLVAATQDQSASSDWYLARDVINIPDNHNAGGRKFIDWRLPTKYELGLLYAQKTEIGGFANSHYWSSIENASPYAWLMNFGTGLQNYGPKDGTYHLRAVRAF